MEAKRFTVCVRICLQTSIEFEAILSGEESKEGMSYVEVEKDGSIIPNRGMIHFNHNLSRIIIAYWGFKMLLDVVQQKTVGNCHHFKCVTDLSRVDVYVCEADKWKECGEDIFIA